MQLLVKNCTHIQHCLKLTAAIYSFNQSMLEVLLESVSRDKTPSYLIFNQLTVLLHQICERAKISIEEFSNALPQTTSKNLKIKINPTGAVIINGIFARDSHGNYLSKAGIKFVDQYLAKGYVNEGSKMEEAFNSLDRKSQTLLQDTVSQKTSLFNH